jgi:hypothetical protein
MTGRHKGAPVVHAVTVRPTQQLLQATLRSDERVAIRPELLDAGLSMTALGIATAVAENGAPLDIDPDVHAERGESWEEVLVALDDLQRGGWIEQDLPDAS